MELDEIFNNQKEPIVDSIQWWQEDKIESLLQLCPYDPHVSEWIIRNLPETRQEAQELIGRLWFDHVPRDPRDQFMKRIKLQTL
jgi:hypothetical protein|tara:strand:+ start:8328 stop:8579 length:252 start_codon:yes stop_codon:yes gene_type:complete